MSLLIIDESKCKQDGFCARDCPRDIIRLKGKKSQIFSPAPAQTAEDYLEVDI